MDEPIYKDRSQFKVVLKDVGKNKDAVLYAVKKITERTLYNSRRVIENTPYTLISSTSKGHAKEVQKELERIGANVEIVELVITKD